MSTTLEDAATGLGQPAEDEHEEPSGQKTAFDRSQYEREDLQIPKIDGQSVDKIRIAFSGSVMLDRSDPADVALFNRLKLGQECELRCAGKVSSSTGGYTTGKEGDLDAIVGQKKVAVETVWVLEPEQL